MNPLEQISQKLEEIKALIPELEGGESNTLIDKVYGQMDEVYGGLDGFYGEDEDEEEVWDDEDEEEV